MSRKPRWALLPARLPDDTSGIAESMFSRMARRLGESTRRRRDDSRRKSAAENIFSGIYDTLNTHLKDVLILITKQLYFYYINITEAEC